MNTSLVRIDAGFDGGNILSTGAQTPSDIRLKIRPDNQADYKQWFFFRASHVARKHCHFTIEEAADASYPEAWVDCAVFVSSDRCTWYLQRTQYKYGCLCFSITPGSDVCYIALHTPYSLERHLDLINGSLLHPDCSLYGSATTVQSRSVEVLQIGLLEAAKPVVWIIARQHPAETMSEWFMEGLLKHVLSNEDASGRAITDRATLYLVPNMNPDGSVLGNFRTNAAGTDLNRAWDSPYEETSPEVLFVKACMDTTGVDLFLDIHGDEDIHYAFAAGCEGIPGYSTQQSELDQQFRHAFNKANPDFSTDNGYPIDEPGEADMRIACHQIAHRFGCPSLTIEIPYVDNQYLPDALYGWSSERSLRLGASVLQPIHAVLDQLR